MVFTVRLVGLSGRVTLRWQVGQTVECMTAPRCVQAIGERWYDDALIVATRHTPLKENPQFGSRIHKNAATKLSPDLLSCSGQL
jgi:hypothetical protein